MTPKEKAKELVSKFDGDLITAGWGETAFIDSKQCALIAVDEIIKALNDDIYIQGETDIDSHIEHWQEVKQEIENG